MKRMDGLGAGLWVHNADCWLFDIGVWIERIEMNCITILDVQIDGVLF
jgi:hypothetical protein